MKFFLLSSITLLISLTSLSSFADWQSAGDALESSDGVDGDYFGYSVDIGTSYAVVGAPIEGTDGAAYVFENQDGSWTQMQKLSNPLIPVNYDIRTFGYSVAIAKSVAFKPTSTPDLLVIGAPDSIYDNYLTGTNYKTGAFCTYELDNGTWVQNEYCTVGGSPDYKSLGYSVDINSYLASTFTIGGTIITASAQIIIGDPHYSNSSLDNTGKAIIYDYNRSTSEWDELTRLASNDSQQENAYFGSSVAMSYGTAIIGEPGRNRSLNTATEIGKVYFYNTKTDLLTGMDKPDHYFSGSSEHHFGTSVDIDGLTALVGAEKQYLDNDIGAAYIYKYENSAWVYDDILPAPSIIDEYADGYGKSVSIKGNFLVVGAPTDGMYNYKLQRRTESGSVVIYENANDTWSETKYYYGYPGEELLFGQNTSITSQGLLFAGAHGAEKVDMYQHFTPPEPEVNINPALIIYTLD